MAVNILLKRSATASKRPVGASMAFGELNLNYDAATGGLFYKDGSGGVVKVGPCQVSATAPNSSPAGSSGNSAGEFWFDTATQTLKVYNGTAWVEAGGSVQGVTGTAPITVNNSDPLNPIVGVNAASTTAPGAVQLNDTTSSTSTAEALTANQGRVLQEQIDALVITSNLTLAGTYNADTGLLDNVTTAGAAVGFVNGSALPAPASGNQDYFVIVDVEGSTGPSGTPPYHVGDWFLSDGSAWLFLNVGFQAPYATTTTEGVVQLATDVEVQAGVNTDHVVTPSGLQSKLSDSVISSSSTTIASSLAVKDAYDAGFQGQTDAAAAQATANQAAIDAAAAQATADAALPKAGGTMTGNLYISNSELQVDSTGTFTSAGTATFTGTTDLNGATSFFFTPTWLENIGPASQVTFNNTASGLAATQVQAAIDELDGLVEAATLWTETAGVLSPATTNTVVTVDVPMGIDGVTVTDSALSVSTLISPAQAIFLDNIQSVTVSGSNSLITHVVDSLTATIPGILAVDESANPVPYNLQIGELQLNGNAGTAGYVLTSNGPGSSPTWEVNAADGVQSVSGTSPITVDNTDPANPVVGIDAASTTAPGAVQLNNTVTSTSTTEAATANAAKTAYDAAHAAQINATQALAEVITAQTDATQALSDAAAAQTTADAALPKAGGTMTGNITFQDAGEGVVFSNSSAIYAISDSVTSTSSTTAASSAAVKAAYDAAVGAQTNGPLTSNTVLYVNCTDGNDLTGARGTDFPFATIGAALAAASEGDTIFLSAGTFTENFTISKGVHLAGTFSDQATWSGTKILGNVVVNLVGAGVIRNLAVSDIYFISANSTSPVSITGMSPGAGGINTFTGCTFTQQDVTNTAQFAFQTSGTWTRSVYLRNCTIDGNFRHNAGTAAGASGYIVIDELLGVGNPNMYHSILTGTVEYRNPSNTLASILQTGGVVLINNASSGITANNAVTSSVFGGTGFSYKGSAAAAGAGTVYFQGGSNQGTGKVDIGANLIYGWTNLTIDPANLTVSGSAIAYTTAVPSAANAQSITQQRPRMDLLKSTSSVAAANQLATVVDSATGALYTVASMDAGTY